MITKPCYYRTNPLSKRSQFISACKARIIDQLATNAKLLHDALAKDDYDATIHHLYDTLSTILKMLLVLDGKPLPNAAIWVNARLEQHKPWDYAINAIMSIAQDVPVSSSKELMDAIADLTSSMIREEIK